MTRPRQNPRSLGMSVLECVIAISILGTAVVAGLSLLEIHELTYATQSMAGEAILIVEREMERVRAADFGFLATTAFVPVPENPDFSTRRVVSSVDGVTVEVAVQVQWTSPTGVVRTDELVTRRCEGVE